MKLMIVDDHPGVRSMIRQLVAVAGDTVCECSTGEEAARLAGNFQPDCVTMDIRLPGLNGFDATRAVLAAHPSARVFIVTLFNPPSLQDDAAQAGAAGYVLKDNLASLRTTLLAGHPGDDARTGVPFLSGS